VKFGHMTENPTCRCLFLYEIHLN